MNGPQHFAEAERLLDEMDYSSARNNIAAAQVHATLALAAATVDSANAIDFHGAQDHTGHAVANEEAWAGVLA